MEANRYIGIFITGNTANVAVVDSQGSSYTLDDFFQVTTETIADQDVDSIGSQIRAELNSRNITVNECSLAMDCSMFTQHNIYSDFHDVRQISQTIRFDAEEAMGMDIADQAITFTVTRKEDNGTRASVFTAKKNLLEGIIKDLQKNGLDPTTVEPDSICLARCIEKDIDVASETHPLFSVFGEKSCYMFIPGRSGEQPYVRSFLCNDQINRENLLKREVPLTVNSPAVSVPVTAVYTNDVKDMESLAERLDVTVLDLKSNNKNEKGFASVEPEKAVAASIACGAAMINFVRTPRIDFRKDFMPYEGKKKVMETSIRLILIACTVILVAFALMATVKIVNIRRDISSIKTKTTEEASNAKKGKPLSSYPKMDLESELKKLKSAKSGNSSGDESTITARLIQILEAINNAPKEIDLKIDSITIAEKSIRLDGSTKSRNDTQALLNEFRKHKQLKVDQETLKQVGPEDRFIINLEAVK